MTPIEAMTAFKENIPIEHNGKVYDKIEQVIYKKANPGGEIIMSLKVRTSDKGTMDINVAWCKPVGREVKKVV